jgi:hypothetical protein
MSGSSEIDGALRAAARVPVVEEVGGRVDVDPQAPWASWPRPVTVQAALHDVRAEARDGRLVLLAGDAEVGVPSLGALREMSTRVGFPVDFLAKLTAPLRAAVVNERIAANDDSRFTFTGEDRPGEGGAPVRHVTNVSPGWRGVLAPADVCQVVWDLLREVYGPETRVKLATRGDSECRMTVMTPWEEPVTRAVGDVVGLGVGLRYSPGMDLRVYLMIERLRCLNGMTSTESAFDWGARAVGRPEDQLAWLTVGVAQAVTAFDDFVERARRMAEATVAGDPRTALIERARAMRVPARFDDRLLASFDFEPGATEWHMVNAFTHLATHGGLPEASASSIQAAAGAWTQSFDMVTARLPRPVALQVGAHVIE